MKKIALLLAMGCLLASCGGDEGPVNTDMKGRRFFGDRFVNSPNKETFDGMLAPYISMEIDESGNGGVFNASRYVVNRELREITDESQTHFRFTYSQNGVNVTFTYSGSLIPAFVPKTGVLTSSGIDVPMTYNSTVYTLKMVER